MDNIQIVIMAGGRGKRMNADVPKVLVPFNGKPLVEHIIDACLNSGITTKPILVVGYGRDMVMDYFKDRVIYAVQEEQLGTGDAVKSAESVIEENIEHVIVLNGDHPNTTGLLMNNLAQTHLTSKMPLTMATVTVPNFHDWYGAFLHWGRIIRDVNNKILGIKEYKDANDEQKLIMEVNPSYFCFNKKWLFENLKQIQNTNSQGEYYLTDLVQKGAQEGSIAFVAISPEEALGVNSIEELERLEKIVQK